MNKTSQIGQLPTSIAQAGKFMALFLPALCRTLTAVVSIKMASFSIGGFGDSKVFSGLSGSSTQTISK